MMLNDHPTPDVQTELAAIPAEYQDAFRRALEAELAESDDNRTDSDVLHYLRRRRDDFRRGGFIRPDGRPGMVTLSPEALYDQALPQLARQALGNDAPDGERRRTLLKVVGFLLLAVLLLLFVVRGRTRRAAQLAATAEATTAAVVDASATIEPTPELPPVVAADEALSTLGGLGGTLTLGRPSALELRYAATETIIALPVDPSRPTPQGELRYDLATMRSDTPVAVWLFGTVLNYGIGIPESMVRNLAVGDRLTLSTDTGATLRFIVSERRERASHEATQLLSQNRLGLTLFALPARAADAVPIALAEYDLAGEQALTEPAAALGEPIPFGADSQITIGTVDYEHTTDGVIRIVLNGTCDNCESTTIMLSLTSSREQTSAEPLTVDGDGRWQTAFTLAADGVGADLLAEVRPLPYDLTVVQLGQIPNLLEQLEIAVAAAVWQPAEETISMRLTVTNPGPGAVWLPPDFIQHPAPQGGDVYGALGQTDPRLPLLLQPAAATGLQFALLPQGSSIQLQIGTGLWELSGLDAARTAVTTPEAGR